MSGDSALIKSEEQIDFVLSCPDMSAWLKETLAAARGRDPINVLNDLEILNHILKARSNALIRSALEKCG